MMSNISVVIPIFNEKECLPELYERLTKVMAPYQDYELLFVNDGSKDNSYEILLGMARSDSKVKIINLSRNFGKEIAVTAGIDHARGNAVVVIDADLQDQPELINELVAKWREGYEVIYAKRLSRKGEPFFKKFSSSFFYKIFCRLVNFDIPQNTGDFRLLDKKAAQAIREVKDKNRFMKGIFAWIGFRSAEITYHREKRYGGKTKWNKLQLLGLAIDGITSFSSFPLRLSMYLGVMLSFFSFSYLAFIVIRTMVLGGDIPGYPSLLSVILCLGGIQFILIGILGEYIGKISSEVKSRPLYFVQNRIGFEQEVEKNYCDQNRSCVEVNQ